MLSGNGNENSQKISRSDFTGLLIGRGKKKSNFAGFLGTKLQKNWPILWEISGQTCPESNW